MFLNPTWVLPAVTSVELPVGLNHIESDFCWCDPLIEADEGTHSRRGEPEKDLTHD